MRIAVTQRAAARHSDIVTAVTWTPSNELVSASDDRTCVRWSMAGEPADAPLLRLDDAANAAGGAAGAGAGGGAAGGAAGTGASFTGCEWFPGGGGRRGASVGNDVFACGTTDGRLRLVTRTGKVEKVVEAHRGALICVRWSHDGTALATSGEDGVVKVFSRNGMLRTTLASCDRPVYALAWSPDSDAVAFTTGRDVSIRPLKPSGRKYQWKAHDGLVLCLDWNPVHGQLVSGAEDCRFKVWDAYGRQVHASKRSDFPITAVRWCPDGDLFAVGSFNTLRLCDKAGWSHSMERPESGSIFAISWTSDGTLLAGAGGNGAVIFGSVVDRTLQHNSLEVNLVSPTQCTVEDVTQNLTEHLDFRDRVVKLSLNRTHLVVATATQCCVYSTSSWSSPHVFDLNGTVNLILQAPRFFVLVDHADGVRVFDYDGRVVSTPRAAGLSAEHLNARTLALSDDTIAAVDRTRPGCVLFFDVHTGKQMGDALEHTADISAVSLDTRGPATGRLCSLLDANGDLTITPVHRPEPVRLASTVTTAAWCDATGMLAALADGRVTVWVYPGVVYVDADLVEKSTIVRPAGELGGVADGARLDHFSGTQCVFRRSDGAVIAVPVPPYPVVLYEHCERGEWDDAVRMARHLRGPTIWAALAALAIAGNELNTAEVALAALDEVDKLEYILSIKDIPLPEARAAELLLYRRRYHEAEAALLAAGLTYRAIRANIKLFKWERALELAVKAGEWVDVVVAYRRRYLEQFALEETSKKFVKYGEGIETDWTEVKAKIAKQKQAEKEKGKPYA
jgi:intraflagellar transport protein 80